jgi:hypothetical protein
MALISMTVNILFGCLEIQRKVSEEQSSLTAGMESSGGTPCYHQYVECYCYLWNSAHHLPQSAMWVADCSHVFLLSTENTAHWQLSTSLNSWQV